MSTLDAAVFRKLLKSIATLHNGRWILKWSGGETESILWNSQRTDVTFFNSGLLRMKTGILMSECFYLSRSSAQVVHHPLRHDDKCQFLLMETRKWMYTIYKWSLRASAYFCTIVCFQLYSVNFKFDQFILLRGIIILLL